METLKRWQWAAWILGVLFTVSLAVAGVFFNQVKTSQEEVHSERQVKELALIEKSEKVNELARVRDEFRQSSQRYEKKIAALDSKGNPALDGSGAPIFNTEMGESNLVEKYRMMEERYESLLDNKDAELVEAYARVDRLTIETSRPARSPWGFGLGYSAPLVDWFSLPSATWWAGAAYHLQLLGLDTGVNVKAGVPSATLDRLEQMAKNTLGMIYLEFRP